MPYEPGAYATGSRFWALFHGKGSYAYMIFCQVPLIRRRLSK